MLEPIGIHTMTSRRFGKSTKVQGLNPPPQFATLPIAEDTYIANQSLTTNFNSSTSLEVLLTGSFRKKAWVKPDFSPLPSGAELLSASLILTASSGGSVVSGFTMEIYRVLRDVVANQITWQVWKTGSSWGTAGCSDPTTDYNGSILLGSKTFTGAPLFGDVIEVALNPSEIQSLFDGTYSNDGLILIPEPSFSASLFFASIEHATPAFRPYMEVYYR